VPGFQELLIRKKGVLEGVFYDERRGVAGGYWVMQ